MSIRPPCLVPGTQSSIVHRASRARGVTAHSSPSLITGVMVLPTFGVAVREGEMGCSHVPGTAPATREMNEQEPTRWLESLAALAVEV